MIYTPLIERSDWSECYNHGTNCIMNLPLEDIALVLLTVVVVVVVTSSVVVGETGVVGGGGWFIMH